MNTTGACTATRLTTGARGPGGSVVVVVDATVTGARVTGTVCGVVRDGGRSDARRPPADVHADTSTIDATARAPAATLVRTPRFWRPERPSRTGPVVHGTGER